MGHAFETKGLAHCEGLFLLHAKEKEFSLTDCFVSDSTSAEDYSVYAGYGQMHYFVKWNDSWSLKFKESRHFGFAGVQKDFKYASFELHAKTLPWFFSRLTAHTTDSSFWVAAGFGAGSFELTDFAWYAESENKIFSELHGLWETSLYERSISVGGIYGLNRSFLDVSIWNSTPNYGEKEYFVQDSLFAYVTNLNFARKNSFGIMSFQLVNVKGQFFLEGVSKRDESEKRFLYLPLELDLSYLAMKLDSREWQAQAMFAYLDFEIKKSANRFYETLAPNRALPQSLLQVLSFSILQHNYRVDGSAKMNAGLLGASRQFEMGSFWPFVGVDFWYVNADVDFVKQSESINFMYRVLKTNDYTSRFYALGSIVSLGFEFSYGHFIVDGKASQIVPFYRNVEGNSSDKKESLDLSEKSGKLRPFQNGFSFEVSFGVLF